MRDGSTCRKNESNVVMDTQMCVCKSSLVSADGYFHKDRSSDIKKSGEGRRDVRKEGGGVWYV